MVELDLGAVHMNVKELRRGTLFFLTHDFNELIDGRWIMLLKGSPYVFIYTTCENSTDINHFYCRYGFIKHSHDWFWGFLDAKPC